MKLYSAATIEFATATYAEFHSVDPAQVTVSRNYDGDSDRVIGFRLSLDSDGAQHGADEFFGEWPNRS